MHENSHTTFLVLGAGLDQKGNATLQTLVNAHLAFDSYKTHQPDRVIFSGNKPWNINLSPGFDSEAEQMSSYATDLGLPRNIITLEADSQSTIQNIAFSKPLIQDTERLIIISGKYHIHRAMTIARLGLPDLEIIGIGTTNLIPKKTFVKEIVKHKMIKALLHGVTLGDTDTMLNREESYLNFMQIVGKLKPS